MRTRRAVTALLVGALLVGVLWVGTSIAASAAAPGTGWRLPGQYAYVVGNGTVVASAGQRPVPIASVAKVMTALLVLQAHPLPAGQPGFGLRVRPRDVRDTVRRAALDQSLVPVVAGERLTERQALQALLLPSANNVAIMLARRVAGSVRAFVGRMNSEARALGMTGTHYTDPSGFLPTTRSTASDQLRLVTLALQVPAFRALVRLRTARIPVAGLVRNTDTLLGHDGFSGVKTGSDSAAGGCFAFRAWHRIDGRGVTITGVVLGQPGADPLAAGLRGAKRLVDGVDAALAARLSARTA